MKPTDLTILERRQLEKLREIPGPAPEIEDRVVHTLRSRGLLSPPVAFPWLTALRSSLALAAIAIAFLIGMQQGERRATQRLDAEEMITPYDLDLAAGNAALDLDMDLDPDSAPAKNGEPIAHTRHRGPSVMPDLVAVNDPYLAPEDYASASEQGAFATVEKLRFSQDRSARGDRSDQ